MLCKSISSFLSTGDSVDTLLPVLAPDLIGRTVVEVPWRDGDDGWGDQEAGANYPVILQIQEGGAGHVALPLLLTQIGQK